MSLKGAPLFPPLFCKTKSCMHNKCMGLYGNLAQNSSDCFYRRPFALKFDENPYFLATLTSQNTSQPPRRSHVCASPIPGDPGAVSGGGKESKRARKNSGEEKSRTSERPTSFPGSSLFLPRESTLVAAGCGWSRVC